MNRLDIYSSNGQVVKTAIITNSCERSQTLQESNIVKLVWNDEERVVIPAGSYIIYDSQKFFLIEDYRPQKKGFRNYSYSVTFSAIEGLFIRNIFFRYVEVGEEIWKEPQFSLNANLLTISTIVIDTLNRCNLGVEFSLPSYATTEGSDFYYGNTQLKALSFDGVNIADAISYIAETFETEWWVEDGYILHFDRCEYGDFYQLSDDYEQVGDVWQSKGLKSIENAERSKNIPQRVFVFGSDRNITKKTVQKEQDGGIMNVSYNKFLHLDKAKYPNGYIEVPNVTSGIEEVKFFEEVYPKMTMYVSKDGVRIDNTNPNAPVCYIKSNSLTNGYSNDIAINPTELLIEGCTLMVRFTSGLLQGFDFEAEWYPTREELGLVPKEENDTYIPFGAFVPHEEDEFVLWNLSMPDWAIAQAQLELEAEAIDYIEGVAQTYPDVKCKSEPTFFKNRGVAIHIGRKIELLSDVFDGGTLQSRITSYNYKLTSPYDIDFTLASARATGRLAAIENSIVNQGMMINGVNQTTKAVSRRTWSDAQDLKSMLESLKNQFLLVGEADLDFVFTGNIEVNNETKILTIGAGTLVHNYYTDGVQKGIWLANTDYIINFSSYNEPRYIYFVCSKSSNKVMYIHIPVNSVPHNDNYYYFLLGILSAEFEGERVFHRTSGLTQIAGGTITTEQVQDANRNLIIDFQSVPPRIVARNGAQIIGNIKFLKSDGTISDVPESLEGVVGQDITYLTNSLKDNNSTEVNGGLILTNIIALQNSGQEVTCGINGYDDNPFEDSIAFWAGGTKEDADNKEADFFMTHKGTGKIGAVDFKKGYFVSGGTNGFKTIISSTSNESSAYDEIYIPTNSEIKVETNTNDIAAPGTNNTGQRIKITAPLDKIDSDGYLYVDFNPADDTLSLTITGYVYANSYFNPENRDVYVAIGFDSINILDKEGNIISSVKKDSNHSIAAMNPMNNTLISSSIITRDNSVTFDKDSEGNYVTKVENGNTYYRFSVTVKTGNVSQSANQSTILHKKNDDLFLHLDFYFQIYTKENGINTICGDIDATVSVSIDNFIKPHFKKNYTIIAPNLFAIRNGVSDSEKTKFFIEGLPTTATGLNSGQVYVDNGVLKIKT